MHVYEDTVDELASYAVFSYDVEEADEAYLAGGPAAEKPTITVCRDPKPSDPVYQAFGHSTTRIPGREGPIVDTGAVYNVSGMAAIKRQAAEAETAGHKVVWEKLPKPKAVGGVGKGVEHCYLQALVPGRTQDGRLVRYVTPVIEGESAVPSLYGLNPMSNENTYFGCRHGLMAMIPEGKDDKIIWPEGTRFIKCDKAPSGHWIMGLNHWQDTDKPKQ